jgi:hypothetical protein
MDVGNGYFAYNVADIFKENYGVPYNSTMTIEVEYRPFVTKNEFDESFKKVADSLNLKSVFTQYSTGYSNSKMPDGKKVKDELYIASRYYVSKNHNVLLHVTVATYHVLSVNVIFDDNTVQDETINKLKNVLIEFLDENERKEPKKSKINFICESRMSGLYLKEIDLESVVNSGEVFDLDNHYNDSFKEAYAKIMNSLNGNKNKGIIMLHGFNGTGKTSFLRHLVTAVERKIIYISPDMSARLSDPSFLTFLMDHKNSVLIIEDAENVLKSREAGMNQAVSNLLNVTDGLLGDGLKFQIICTFNTSYDQIDHALKRPGRLIAEYEFTRLDESKTEALVKQIYGETSKPKEKLMSLGEIFNMESTSEFSSSEDKAGKFGIGFTSHLKK